MNNFIEYFYNIKIQKIMYNNKYYSFIYNGYVYKLYILDNNININMIIDIDKRLLGHTLISEIIMNKDREYISKYNGVNYILIKIYVNINKSISLEEINYLANTLYMEKLNINWGKLWSIKIDYLEDLINENGKKYPIIVDSFNYFVGMAENAISYYNDIIIDNNYKYVISHKKINIYDSVESLYNPINIIFDYRARDIAEYIKIAFFLNKKNIYNELDNYISNANLSLTDIKLIIARLLYPSFYFDMYEDILNYNKEEKMILNITDKLGDYEKYLASVINYFRRFYDVPEIPWLNNIYK